VYKVEDRRNNNIKVAVKVVRKGSNYSWTAWRKLLVEIDIMQHNNHPNIARLLEVFQTPLEFVMVIELGEGGSLKRAFEIAKRKEYDVEVFTANVIAQVSAGLDYLYNVRKITHRDIKHDNIVLSKDFSRVLIIDFGLAEYIRSDTQRYVPCGTMGFASPENILAVVERKTTFEAPGLTMHLTDMFSLGVVAFMMLSGQKPLKGARFHDLHQEVRRGIRCTGSKWQDVSDPMRQLVESLLASDTARRALPADVASHAAITASHEKFRELVELRQCEQAKADKEEGDMWVFVASLSAEWKVVADEDFASVGKTGHVASPTSMKSPS
jgi:serine/threonine protein kinase